MDQTEIGPLIKSFDSRRNLAIPGSYASTIEFCVEHFLLCAEEALKERGQFNVALSGGKTPNAVYSRLTSPLYRLRIDWNKVGLYWSDERSVPPFHLDSNYRASMEAGFSNLHISPENIHRMQAEGDIEIGAQAYDELLKKYLPDGCFDLILLGMGEDGHTASLFPRTHGLHVQNKWVAANYIPQLETWRMTLTFDSINRAKNIAVYVLGANKAKMLKEVLTGPYRPEDLPVQQVGLPSNKALWIADSPAAGLLNTA